MAVRQCLTVTTALVLLSIAAVDVFLNGGAFVGGQSRSQLLRSPLEGHESAQHGLEAAQPALQQTLGVKGLLGYGASFGVAIALLRAAAGRQQRTAKVVRAAAEIEVAEQTEEKPVPYLANVPRTILEKRLLIRLLATLPRDQWEDPPEDHPLYPMKMYAEAYGEGKATKMSWWDYWSLQTYKPDDEEIQQWEDTSALYDEWVNEMVTGSLVAKVPGMAEWYEMGPIVKFRGAEPFAGDQIKTLVTDGRYGKQFFANWAFYREGLEPWQRGIEIGMAHGYFLIGPFVSFGPLRNTPEAATVGLLAGCAVVGIVTSGALIFSQTIRPKLFDKPGAPRASGFTELVNWHAIGGIGGAGFAHALLTVFAGSS